MNIIRKTIENDEEYLRQISVPVSLDDKSYETEIDSIVICSANDSATVNLGR